MEHIATPALQTPIGILVVLAMGLVMAFGAWSIREGIDLLFFRLSGGNAQFGKVAAGAVPVVIMVATLWYVADVLFF